VCVVKVNEKELKKEVKSEELQKEAVYYRTAMSHHDH
jgi:hypothetical protein